MDITIEYDAFHPDLQDCPAGCNIDTGVIVINPTLFDVLSDFQKKFVLLHEEGHIRLHTHDEIQADAYAFDRLAGTEFRSLKQSVEFLEQLLNPAYPTNEVRKASLYKRALDWDKKHTLTDGLFTLKIGKWDIFSIGDANTDAINAQKAADKAAEIAIRAEGEKQAGDALLQQTAVNPETAKYVGYTLAAIVVIALSYFLINKK